MDSFGFTYKSQLGFVSEHVNNLQGRKESAMMVIVMVMVMVMVMMDLSKAFFTLDHQIKTLITSPTDLLCLALSVKPNYFSQKNKEFAASAALLKSFFLFVVHFPASHIHTIVCMYIHVE